MKDIGKEMTETHKLGQRKFWTRIKTRQDIKIKRKRQEPLQTDTKELLETWTQNYLTFQNHNVPMEVQLMGQVYFLNVLQETQIPQMETDMTI